MGWPCVSVQSQLQGLRAKGPFQETVNLEEPDLVCNYTLVQYMFDDSIFFTNIEKYRHVTELCMYQSCLLPTVVAEGNSTDARNPATLSHFTFTAITSGRQPYCLWLINVDIKAERG